jgi:hypothetical protein
MKYLLLVLFTFFLSVKSYAQSDKTIIKDDEITVPLNTGLKISTQEKNGKFSDFEIITQSKIKSPINMMAVMEKIERKEIISDEIDFKFSEADFMGSKSIILTTVQHFTKPVIFKAKIRIKGNKNYVETSIVPKAPHVFSVEEWRDDIDSIILSDLKKNRNQVSFSL